jgi:hypothetical protein
MRHLTALVTHMATPSPACICPPNRDSGLSTAANILSILTFVYVFALGTCYSFVVRRSSKGEVFRLRSKARTLRARYEATRPHVEGLQAVGDLASRAHEIGCVKSSFAHAEKNLTQMEEFMTRLPSTAEGSGDRWYLIWSYLKAVPAMDRLRSLNESAGVSLYITQVKLCVLSERII